MITVLERQTLKKFKNMSIPHIFKDDYIEFMLFFELIDFDICTLLLNNRILSEKLYKEAMCGYEMLKDHLDINVLDDSALEYYNLCLSIREIMIKHYSEKYDN